VFVLREVFDLGYDEIVEAVDKSPAAVRQRACSTSSRRTSSS
jgi:RNA polymerase sigma-70 factor (ECF subfamily)